MSRPIGVSTHAVRPGDLASALAVLRPLGLPAVELSALRERDLRRLVESLGALDLSGYTYVSFHAPSAFTGQSEEEVADLMMPLAGRGWPVIVHPDTLTRDTVWERLGDRLCIENMDKRKSTGRTTAELESLFTRFPRASFCFDIGHARQVDPTMSEAALMLRRFRGRLRQLHLSDVTSLSRHEAISYTALNSFRKVAQLIPADVPVILETPFTTDGFEAQLHLAEKALSPADDGTGAHALNGAARSARQTAGDCVSQ
jgi:hypothetical protein